MNRNFTISKKIISLSALLCGIVTLHAQNTFRISPGTKLTMGGNVQLSLNTTNLINNGTLSSSGGGGSTLIFAGPVNLSGTGTTQVQNFVVSHSSVVASSLHAPISITNTASLAFGNIDLNSNLLIRSDLSNTANLVVTGAPSSAVDGLTAKASIESGACPTFTTLLSLNISGPQLFYQWQSSADSIVWTDVSGATTHNYTATVSKTTYYRCRVTSSSNNYDQLVDAIKVSFDTSAAAITGVNTIEAGTSATLSSITTGGIWRSSSPSVVAVNATTGVITGMIPGTATITYTALNVNSCTGNATTTITVTPSTNRPVVTITNPAAVCAPATVNLTAAAVTAGSVTGLAYTYYTDAATTIPLTSPDKVAAGGTYYIVGTNSAGIASAPMPVTVTIIQAPGLKAAFTFDSYCINTPVVFTNTSTTAGTVSYQWSDNTGKTSVAVSPSFTYTQTGAVNMKLKVSSLACPLVADSTTQTITIEQPIAAIRMQPVNIVANAATEIRARNFGSSYIWTPATGLSNTLVFNPKASLTNAEQEYRISIKAASGCITVDTLLVRIFDKYLYVPNAFTPNGDGVNDLLFVNLTGNGTRTLSYFRVYNRYSKIVFQTTDITKGWDGKVNGVLQPIDTYMWVAEAKDAAGVPTMRRGNVSLLR